MRRDFRFVASLVDRLLHRESPSRRLLGGWLKLRLCGSFVLALYAALCASESWESKPFQTWSAREIEQIRARSPWAHGVSAAVPIAEILVFGGEGKRGAGEPVSPSQLGRADRAGRLPDGPGRESGIEVESEAPAVDTRVIPMILRWDSALPLRHARLREKYGDEVLTSRAAAEAMQREVPDYVILVSGFPPLNERNIPGGLDRAFLENTTLLAKGKNALKPSDVDIAPRGRTLDVTFKFARTVPFKIEDQEVEFSMAAGPLHLKHKFRLKAMVYRGSLTL